MRSKRVVVVLAFVFSVLILMLAVGNGQSTAATPNTANTQQAAAQPKLDSVTASELSYANSLLAAHKRGEAYPYFEKLSKELPNDFAVQEAWADCLVAHAATLTDPETHAQELMRARKVYQQLNDAGDSSDIVKVMLSSIPADGKSQPFSGDKEVDRLMKAGEAAFSQGNFDEAIENYKKAGALNPKLYSAALYVGDSYYAKGDVQNAGEWFSRAIEIDPGRETAYRYWADALLKQGSFADAREKLVQAVICSPYEQRTWMGVNNYLRVAKVKEALKNA